MVEELASVTTTVSTYYEIVEAHVVVAKVRYLM